MSLCVQSGRLRGRWISGAQEPGAEERTEIETVAQIAAVIGEHGETEVLHGLRGNCPGSVYGPVDGAGQRGGVCAPSLAFRPGLSMAEKYEFSASLFLRLPLATREGEPV